MIRPYNLCRLQRPLLKQHGQATVSGWNLEELSDNLNVRSLLDDFSWNDFQKHLDFNVTERRKTTTTTTTAWKLPSLKLNVRPWKSVVGSWNVLFGARPILRGELLVSGSTSEFPKEIYRWFGLNRLGRYIYQCAVYKLRLKMTTFSRWSFVCH